MRAARAIAIGGLVLVAAAALVAAANASGLAKQEQCPTSAGWTKVDSTDMSAYPVDGATAYCFKAGSDNSQGCLGGLFDSWPLPEGACGLSHWAYYVPPASATPSATYTPEPDTPTPTDTDTPTPTATASATPEEPPTSTPTTDPDVTPTATPTLTATPEPTATSTPGQLTETPDIACRNDQGTVIPDCHHGKG